MPITSTAPANSFAGIDQAITCGAVRTVIIHSTAVFAIQFPLQGFDIQYSFKCPARYQSATGAVADSNTGLLTITPAQFANLQSLFFYIGDVTYELTPERATLARALNTAIKWHGGQHIPHPTVEFYSWIYMSRDKLIYIVSDGAPGIFAIVEKRLFVYYRRTLRGRSPDINERLDTHTAHRVLPGVLSLSPICSPYSRSRSFRRRDGEFARYPRTSCYPTVRAAAQLHRHVEPPPDRQARAKALKLRAQANLGKFQHRAIFDVPATNQAVQYVANVGVGTPPTQYSLLIDTGSSNTWVGAGQAFVETNSTVNTGQLVEVVYGSGFVIGEEFTDTVTLADGFAIEGQSIGAAIESEGFDGLDGIIGQAL
ncbi:Polyporopepsin [Grifola frondosa]|uniref:Polyporopepsin n=1 Tax=Grifola frondosa TaxID=5627 RepID=A0A1C7MJC6_GRIFR|nr:Polyporopepsin [Grifola frondosa]